MTTYTEWSPSNIWTSSHNLWRLSEKHEVQSFYCYRNGDFTDEVVRCHNASTARAIRDGRAPCKEVQVTNHTVEAIAFVSPSGQYYVECENPFIRTSNPIRVDVANVHTARRYVRDGVGFGTLLEVFQATTKVAS